MQGWGSERGDLAQMLSAVQGARVMGDGVFWRSIWWRERVALVVSSQCFLCGCRAGRGRGSERARRPSRLLCFAVSRFARVREVD